MIANAAGEKNLDDKMAHMAASLLRINYEES